MQRSGVKGKLTSDELAVVAGYALFLLERRHVVDHHVIIDFVASAFDETVQQPWVSKHMHQVGFSSHRPPRPVMAVLQRRRATHRYRLCERAPPDAQRIRRHEPYCGNGPDQLLGQRPRHVLLCAYWQVRSDFFFSFHLFHTTLALISLLDSGQPRVLDRGFGNKVLLYSAFMANGECWPPVIFTSKKTEDRGSRSIRRLED
jgi:hypothetical protein